MTRKKFLENMLLDINEITILIVVFVVSLFVVRTLKTFLSGKTYPPSPWGFPIVGHLPLFGSYPPAKLQKWREQYGDVYRIRMGAWDTVVINGYSAIKDALERSDDAFSGRPKFFVFETLRKVSGNQESIAFGPFDYSYLKLRRHCANALNKITNTYQESTEDIIIEEASVLTNTLIAWNGEPGYLSTEIQVTVASIIHQILFGKEENAQNNEDLQDQIRSVNAFNRASGVGNLFDVMPWLRYVMPWKASEIQRIIQTSSDVRYKLTLNAKETFDINNMRKSIADMFLNADVPDKVADETQSVTRERLLRNINTLAGAGIETTSSTMMWLMTYMAAFPEVQARVQNELDSVVGQGRDVTLADRPKLPFTEATVLEVFRITSLVPVSTPRCTIKNTKLNGFDIDAGTVILPNQHSVNMDREFWIDPEQFRPERLLSSSQNLDLVKCNRILTFGHGRRKCVGERLAKMELFLLFANVILRCSIANAQAWPVDLTQVRGLAYRPKPVKVVVRER